MILNLTFTVLNEGKLAETSKGNFGIPAEDYGSISACLEQIKLQIDNLSEIEIEGINYKIEKYIGGDLKILAIIYGINRASSNCPCIWCIWDKRKLKNIEV